MTAVVVLLIILAIFVFVTAAAGVRIVPQAKSGIVERLGRYHRTLGPGLTLIVPYIDRVKPLIDLREQVVTFPPQPVITEDNLVVGIDTVLYFTVTDSKSVTYEVADPLQAIEQLTVTTLRNVIGGMTLEEALTSRDSINSQLRAVLDEATGKWGIRVNRVELKSIEPPRTVQEAMEKQMRAERDRRAVILNAEGVKQSQILTAEGEKQAAVLKAEGARTSAILRAEGESKSIDTVFEAIHRGGPDQGLLSYQYLQMLPQLAQGSANKIFVIPSEFSQALGSLGGAFAGLGGNGASGDGAAGIPERVGPRDPGGTAAADAAAREAAADVAAAKRAASEANAEAEQAATQGGAPPRGAGTSSQRGDTAELEPPAQGEEPPPARPHRPPPPAGGNEPRPRPQRPYGAPPEPGGGGMPPGAPPDYPSPGRGG